MDFISIIFLVTLIGLPFIYYEETSAWLIRHSLFFKERQLSSLIVSPYKQLFFYCRAAIPRSMWSFLYYSSLWEEPYFFVKIFAGSVIASHIFMSFFFPSILSFMMAIILSLAVVISIMSYRNSSNRFLFDQSFPLIINLMNDAIQSGLSLNQSFIVIVRETKGPIHKVFQNMINGIEIGVPLETILNQEKENINHKEFSLLCSALAINNLTGGSLDNMLSKIKITLTTRREFERKMKVAMSSSKADGLVVICITLFLLAFTLFTNPKAVGFFLHDPFGIKLTKILLLLLLGNISCVYMIVNSVKRI